MRTLGLVLLLLVAAICTGCMNCTRYVSRIGTSEIDVLPHTVSRTTATNLVVEMTVARRDLGLNVVYRDLGRRYVFFDGLRAEQIVCAGIAKPGDHWCDSKGTHVNLKIANTVPVTNFTAICTTPQWYLYPGDWEVPSPRPQLPEQHRPVPGTSVNFERRGKSIFTADLPQDIDGNPYYICVHLFRYNFTGKPQSVGWMAPVRWVLYIPAVAIDIVTGPFQVVYMLKAIDSATGGH